MKFKKAMAFALTGALATGTVCTGAFAEDNQTKLTLMVAEPYDSDYVMTIPADLTITSDGFNALGDLKVAHNPEKTETTFDPNKKVTVTATSGNEWQLKATGVADGISYKLKAADTDENATTSWEFTSAEITNDGTTKALGVDVEPYANAEAGEYTDTITFTAEVESTAVAVTGITLNKTETSIQVGNNETLSVTAITPDDATDKTYTWSSDKESVATVDADGKVTAVATGTANITATANDGSGVTATCAVTVTAAVPAYYNKLTKINDNFSDQVYKLKNLGRGRESYNSSLTAAQAYALATYQAAIDGQTVYVIMSSQEDGYSIHYAVSTDTAATEHTSDLYDICDVNKSAVRMYYIAQ